MEELKQAGELDHIEIPKSPLNEALERKSYNKYDFLGIINEMGTMKSYRPEQLDQMSRKSNVFGGNDMSHTFGDVNPLNYTGNFSQHTSHELGQNSADLAVMRSMQLGSQRKSQNRNWQMPGTQRGDKSYGSPLNINTHNTLNSPAPDSY